MITLQESIPEYLDGQRSDLIAVELFPEYSRSRLQNWIKDGSLLVDDKSVRPKDRLSAHSTLSLSVNQAPREDWQAQDICVDVIHEDEELLVINKPVGLVVHPAAGNRDGTLLNGLLYRIPSLAELPRAGIVHRIDKDTSGLLVVAKTLESHTWLVRELQERRITREYLCVAEGGFTAGGTVDAPIGRHPRNRLKMAVKDGGKAAVSHYRVEQRFRHHTVLRVQLETGRTHQIRVHMAHLRHPLVGDQLYAGRPKLPAGITPELRCFLQDFRRQALHARLLRLQHPVSGELMCWTSPVPEDMRELMARLEKETSVKPGLDSLSGCY